MLWGVGASRLTRHVGLCGCICVVTLQAGGAERPLGDTQAVAKALHAESMASAATRDGEERLSHRVHVYPNMPHVFQVRKHDKAASHTLWCHRERGRERKSCSTCSHTSTTH